MKEKNLKITIGLMSAALFGLIAVQFYWITNAIELEEKLFDYNVNEAMNSVVKRISKNETVKYVAHKIIKSSDEDIRLVSNDSLHSVRIINRGKTKSVTSFKQINVYRCYYCLLFCYCFIIPNDAVNLQRD